MEIRSAKDLIVYQKAYQLAMAVFDSSLDFAHDCGYITAQQHRELTGLCQEVGKMLGSIINNPTSVLTPAF